RFDGQCFCYRCIYRNTRHSSGLWRLGLSDGTESRSHREQHAAHTWNIKMRVRKLSTTGGMTFGQGLANFYINSAAGVGQEVVTRLKLIQGEWYLDQSQGVPWFTQILG